MKLGLIEGNILFVDGTKIRANASRGKNYSKGQYQSKLTEIDKRIEKLLEECDRIDEEEKEDGSLVKMKEEVIGQKKLRERIFCAFSMNRQLTHIIATQPLDRRIQTPQANSRNS